MNYIPELNTLMPSLERRALIKTAISLWSPDDIHLRNPHDPRLPDIAWKDEKWIAEDHVIGKVKELPLPESLKKKILGFIKPIGYEILKWIKHYQNILSDRGIYFYSSKSLVDIKKVEKSLSNLCWTPQGTVDRKKTAEELVRDENLDITDRYKLACVYCLRNDILKLWNEMPEYCRKSFYSEDDTRLVKQNDLVVFWTYDVMGEQTRMNKMFKEYWTEQDTPAPDKYGCDSAFDSNNKVATEYFWQNLTSEERDGYLENMDLIIFHECPKDDIVDLLFFFLSQMKEEWLKMLVLEENSSELLSCLLDWPCQDFFMETAELAWAFLPDHHYLFLLESIIYKVKNGYKDYDYKNLFRKFWQQSPITHKQYVKDSVHDGLYNDLLEIEDKEYLKIIFPSNSDREKLLLSDDGKYFCEGLFLNNKMDSLKALVRECVSSKDIIIKFREEFKNHILLLYYCSNIKLTREEIRDKFSEFFQFLDELIVEDDNRKRVDEGNADPAAKRLCSHNK